MKRHQLAFVDLETTALDPFVGEVIEIGVVIADQVALPDGRPSLSFVSEHLIALTPTHLETADPKSLEICRYHERDWTHAVPPRAGLDTLATLLSGKVFVGQNVAFDWGYLLHAGEAHGVAFDSQVHYHKLDLASMAFGKLYTEEQLFRFSLREMAEYFGVENKAAHTALSDAQTTFEVCKRLLER